MLKNVGTVLDNNPELTMACINLAMHSAITTDKTYLADKESTQQKFIGYGCDTYIFMQAAKADVATFAK